MHMLHTTTINVIMSNCISICGLAGENGPVGGVSYY